VLALVEQPPVITALTPRGNSITIHSYIKGRPEAIATWHTESLHIYLVTTLAMALAVPLKSLRQRARLGCLALGVSLLTTLTLCLVELKIAAETYASTSLGMTLYTLREKIFLNWANWALVLVAMMLLPVSLFLISYLSYWSESAARAEPAGRKRRPPPKRRLSSWKTWGIVSLGIATLGATWVLLAPRRAEPAHRSYLEGFQQLLALNPSAARAHFALALYYEDEGRLSEAADLYRKSLEIDPGLVEAQFDLGNVLFKQKGYREAVEWYEKALKRDPGHLSARNNLGSALFQEGLYERAARAFEDALQADERHAFTHNNLGLTLVHLGRLCEALGHLERSIELDGRIGADPAVGSRIRQLRVACRNESQGAEKNPVRTRDTAARFVSAKNP